MTANPTFPTWRSARVALVKIICSSNKRRKPGTGTGAFPELLASPGTLNVPQTIAAIRGVLIANTKRKTPSHWLHPQYPRMISANSSRMNRTIRLIGFWLIYFSLGDIPSSLLFSIKSLTDAGTTIFVSPHFLKRKSHRSKPSSIVMVLINPHPSISLYKM